MRTNTTKEGYREERYRLICRAKVLHEDEIRTHIKTDSQECGENGEGCSHPGEGSGSVEYRTPNLFEAKTGSACKSANGKRGENARGKDEELSNQIAMLNDEIRRYRAHRQLFAGFCGCKDLGMFRMCRRCVQPLIPEHKNSKNKDRNETVEKKGP